MTQNESCNHRIRQMAPTALFLDDSIHTCDCCGRSELKHTMAMKLEDGSLVHYGTTCAARNSGKDQRQLKKEMVADRAAREGRAFNELRQHPARKAWQQRRVELAPLSLSPSEWARAIAREAQQLDAARAEIAARHRISISFL